MRQVNETLYNAHQCTAECSDHTQQSRDTEHEQKLSKRLQQHHPCTGCAGRLLYDCPDMR